MKFNVIKSEYVDVEVPDNEILEASVKILTNILRKNNNKLNDYDYFYKSDDKIIGVEEGYHGSESRTDITDKLSDDDKKLMDVIVFLQNVIE